MRARTARISRPVSIDQQNRRAGTEEIQQAAALLFGRAPGVWGFATRTLPRAFSSVDWVMRIAHTGGTATG